MESTQFIVTYKGYPMGSDRTFGPFDTQAKAVAFAATLNVKAGRRVATVAPMLPPAVEREIEFTITVYVPAGDETPAEAVVRKVEKVIENHTDWMARSGVGYGGTFSGPALRERDKRSTLPASSDEPRHHQDCGHFHHENAACPPLDEPCGSYLCCFL